MTLVRSLPRSPPAGRRLRSPRGKLVAAASAGREAPMDPPEQRNDSFATKPSRRARSVRPAYIEPMKALGVTLVPGDSWRCELKFDGYRAVAVLDRGKVELWSRNHRPM